MTLWREGRWALWLGGSTVVLALLQGCGSGHGSVSGPSEAPTPPAPEAPLSSTVDMEEFIVPTRHDAPVPWLLQGDMLYTWSWVKVEDGKGTYTPPTNYVMVQIAPDGFRLRRDKTWGTQNPGLYYEQDTLWMRPVMRIGDRVTETRGRRYVYRLSDCGFEYGEPARSDNILEAHRMQYIGPVWGTLEIIVVTEPNYRESYAYARGLGLVGYSGGGAWRWFDWRYVGPQPTPQGC